MQFFRCHERKSILQVEAELAAEHRQRADARAVFFFDAVFQNILQKLQILPQCSHLTLYHTIKQRMVNHLSIKKRAFYEARSANPRINAYVLGAAARNVCRVLSLA